MSIRAIRSRYRVLSQAAAIALVAGMGAACSGDVTRFSQPVFKNPFKRTARVEQPSPPSDVGYASNGYDRNSFDPPSRNSVARVDLPPPSDYGAVNRNYDPPVDRYEPNRDYASAPEASRSGNGITIRVGTGDTLSSISRRYGVPMSTIARANDIYDPSRVQSGQRLYIPGASEDTSRYDVANVDSRNFGSNSASRAGRTAPGPSILGTIPASPDDRYTADATVGDRHVVGSGETLGGIAAQYGVSRGDLMAANGINDPNLIREGQRLVIPGSGRSSNRMVASLDGAPRVARAEVERDAYRGDNYGNDNYANDYEPQPRETSSLPRYRDPVDGPAGYTPPAARDDVAALDPADKGSVDGQQFRWPVRGRIISGFGAKPNGERNDGINLAVPEGTAVKAAEGGTVIYAGNEIAGYGNLILVRHAGGWVTAYAHASDMLVRRGDTVRRGQTIAHAGATGSVNSPQLHFELRRGSNPVNPMDYMAGA